MSEKKWIKLKNLRGPARRRLGRAARDRSRRALLEEAVIAAAQMKRQGGDGGRVPQ